MRVLVTGGGGMIGQKFAHQLAASDLAIRELILHDIEEPADLPDSRFKVTCITGNLAKQMESKRIAEYGADVIVHLAAIVSGEAEAVFEKGWAVNGRGTYNLLEAIRHHGMAQGSIYRPKFIYASSIAVFGAPFPVAIDDEFLLAPQTSYGAQKAVGEMFVSDYSRKGFIDGISIRFPTICVRPGLPNKAASSFFSSIIREPLQGRNAVLPVSREVRHWFASPRSAAGFIIRAMRLDFHRLENRRALNMPGISLSIGEMMEALERVAGSEILSHIKEKPDETIMEIVASWPHAFDPQRALELGFTAEESFDEIIQVFIEDDLKK